jgi:hydroxyacylglutathione hydrolase
LTVKKTTHTMTLIQAFTVNPFAENTYVVYDDSGECIILDPGCYTSAEREQLRQFIREKNLRPVRLINTHGHLDHVFGNQFVSQTWQLGLEIHRGELPTLERYPMACQLYGIVDAPPCPPPARFIEPGETIAFGHTQLTALYTPGHSPASLSFYCAAAGFVLAGDVLFLESIGRTDLPGGNFAVLEQSIRNQLFVLPGETIVYSGHGPETTIRHEKEYNPFLQ